MLNSSTRKSLRQASGEELLLLAILGPSNMKPKIDRELDRRALADVVTHSAILPAAFVPTAGHAA